MAKANRGAGEIWLEEGLRALEEGGPLSLSIDNLAARTGKTKGSFYYHFKSRERFIEALLAHYESKSTLEIFHAAEAEGDPEARRRKLVLLIFQVSSRLEIIVRAWSLYDPLVRGYQDRMDRYRLEHLVRLYLSSGMDRPAAEVRAYRNYSLYIGVQQIRHLMGGKDFDLLVQGFFTPFAPGEGKQEKATENTKPA